MNKEFVRPYYYFSINMAMPRGQVNMFCICVHLLMCVNLLVFFIGLKINVVTHDTLVHFHLLTRLSTFFHG